MCEVITIREKVDEARFHILHHFATRPKDTIPIVEDEGMVQHQKKDEQVPDEGSQTESNG